MWRDRYFDIVNELSHTTPAKVEQKHSESHSKESSDSHTKEHSESCKEVAEARYQIVWNSLIRPEQILLHHDEKVSLPLRDFKLITDARCDRYSKVLAA